MKLHIFLMNCRINRPVKLPEKKTIKSGSEFNIKTLKDKKDSCRKEIQITKQIEGIFSIELIYIAEYEKKDEKIIDEKIRSILTMEANLLVSNLIKEMHFPPFPLLLGNFSDEKSKNKRTGT